MASIDSFDGANIVVLGGTGAQGLSVVKGDYVNTTACTTC